MSNNKKLIIAVVALSLALCCAIGGTLAYLRDVTNTVTNTFTYGDIIISLDETENLDLKMVPGNTIAKDPTVTVDLTSEACYLFVKIDESTALKQYITYEVNEDWEPLKIDGQTVAGVYYMTLETIPTDNTFSILQDDEVTVLTSVTKEMMKAVKDNPTLVQLSFTAYAVQLDNLDLKGAWNIALGG